MSYMQNKDLQIKELESKLIQKEIHIRTLEESIQAKDIQINNLKIQIQEIQSGIVMRLLKKYQSLIEKLLQTGTKRRYYYELGLSGMRIILNEGCRSFWIKYKSRKFYIKQKKLSVSKCHFINKRTSNIQIFLTGTKRYIKENGGGIKGFVNSINKLLIILTTSGSSNLSTRISNYINSTKLSSNSYSIVERNILFTKYSRTVLKPHITDVDIIIAVHNALPHVKLCLESIIENSQQPYNIIIIDDGSDYETKIFLEKFSIHEKVILLRNEIAKGYVESANRGLSVSKSQYVILLNSDTQVGPEWLDRMITCAEVNPMVGLVGPLSNTASYQSIPIVKNGDGDWCRNNLPEHLNLKQTCELIAKESHQIYPEMPFLNGFCLLIKKQVIEQVGYFDTKNFKDGYGEENDYCIRARDKGWKLALADDVYVFHAQSASYTDNKRKILSQRASLILEKKHSNINIHDNAQYMLLDKTLVGIRMLARVNFERDRLRKTGNSIWKGNKVLFVLPTQKISGGCNVIIQEAEAMIKMGIDARIFNYRSYRSDFENCYPNIQIPIIYSSEDEFIDIASKFDAVIATHNSTVRLLSGLANLKKTPKLAYYIQDYEPYFYPKNSRGYQQAGETYTLLPNLIRITKTIWNQRKVMINHKVDSILVGPSVNIDNFYPRKYIFDSHKFPLKISAMIRPSTPRRGAGITMEVLEQIYRKFKNNIEIYLFGDDPNLPQFNLLSRNFEYKHFGLLSSSQLSILFNQIDVFVDLSPFQAMGLTAMEAMACGCAVIVPKNGGSTDFITHKYNGLVVDTSNITKCYYAIERLILDDSLRNRMKMNAVESILKYHPERASFNILKSIFDIKSNNPFD